MYVGLLRGTGECVCWAFCWGNPASPVLGEVHDWHQQGEEGHRRGNLGTVSTRPRSNLGINRVLVGLGASKGT